MNGKKIGGWIVRDGIAAGEDDMRQTYTDPFEPWLCLKTL